MSSILNRVQMFLTEANKASVDISSTIVNEFGEACKQAFKKQFTDTRENKFRIRMSSIGRPLCQLQMEKSGAEAEPMPYNAKMRNLFGDLIEASAVAIMKAAGIRIEDLQKEVKLKLGKQTIKGTYDVKIQNKIWDIKSASPYSFDHKFGEDGGFDAILKQDTFGYVSQGYLYSNAEKTDFGGWIAINKSTGEWSIAETPLSDSKYSKDAIELAQKNIEALESNAPFKRLFKDEEEFFNKKATGNRTLGLECRFCAYKKPCWGKNLQYLPQQQSKALNPKWVWYTEVNNPREEVNV
jgi:hypothetical protein|tara:strand:- start:2963 stop:3850 length:888 start_codon:yes stop_codon:yes gene_type:complete